MNRFPSGLSSAPGVLIDERCRPDFRSVFGSLARGASEISTAVTRVRLATLDLSDDELASVEEFRVLVAELNALRLDSEARAVRTEPGRARNVALLLEMLHAGRLQVRSAPLGGWSPDFTVFARGATAQAVLTGFHAFERPYPHRGPLLASLHGPEGARLALQRFEDVWTAAHDVGPALWSILSSTLDGRREAAHSHG